MRSLKSVSIRFIDECWHFCITYSVLCRCRNLIFYIISGSSFLSLASLLYVDYVLLVAIILHQLLFTTPVFPTLPQEIPPIFPVKVTYKTSTKKSAKAKTKKLTYTMKVAKASVALSGESAVAVGSTTKLTTTKKASSRAKITYTSSDDTIATVSEDGTVKGVKAGKATIKATLKIGKDTATTTQEVEVKKYVLKSVAQTKADTFETSVTGATKEIKASEITVKNTENNVIVPVKSVSVDSKDATKVTFTTFAGLTDGKTYDVTLDGTTKQVVVSDGKVASVNVNKLTVPVATETEIKLVSKDANGVVLDESAYGSQDASKYDFSLTTNNGYVNGSKLYLNKIGDTATAEVTYKSGKYGTDGKPEGNITSGKVTITAVDQATVNNFAVKVADRNAQNKKFDKIDANTQVAVGDNAYAYFQIKDADGNEISNYYDYSLESSDKAVLMLGDTSLADAANSNHRVLVTPVKAGTAYILIKKDNKIVSSVAITVVADRAVATMDVDKTAATLSNAMSKNATVTASFKDQYAKDIALSSVDGTVKVTCLSTTAKDKKPSDITADNDYFSEITKTGNKAKVTFYADVDAGTYQYKISYEKDTKEVCARVITITIQEPKDPSQGTESFALDVNKTEIDNLVDNDHNTPADYVITASVNQMINGVANQTLSRGTELKDNTTEVKSITYKLEDKDGKDVSANTGCDITMGRNTMTVQTVSFSAFTAEKNFGAGTYKITATVKTGKKTESDSTKWVTKTFTTTFTVKDTQPTGDMSLEKDSIDRVSDSEALVKAAVKLVYGDHTYGVDDENMSIVSVEGITNTGAKLDKDHTAISSSVKSVTIKKITFTVDSGAYKVDITKDISSNPYVISFK